VPGEESTASIPALLDAARRGDRAAAGARLPEDYREVIVLRNLEGLSHEEAARRTGRGVGWCECSGCGRWRVYAAS
jgi:DNA-directed RNA polymerase specialized sigma24 family protein